MAKGLTLNKLMQQQMAANPAFAEMYKMTYGYGDFAGEETVWRLLLGKDTLELGSTPDGKAQTTTGANGNRIIRMNGTSVADMAVTLQHEAWRDGNIGSTQAQRDKETFKATQAHTQLALALLGSSEYGRQMNAAIGGSKNLQKDIKNYLDPEGNFEQYVKDNYDSSADYWKIIVQRDASGNIIGNQLIDDLSGDLTVEDGGKTTIYKTGVSAAKRYEWMAKAFGTDEEGLVQALLGTKLMLGTASGTSIDASLWMSINQDQLTYLTAMATSMRTGTLPSYATMSEENKIHKVDWDTWAATITGYNASVASSAGGLATEILGRAGVDQQQKSILGADVYWQVDSMIKARDTALLDSINIFQYGTDSANVLGLIGQGIKSITGNTTGIALFAGSLSNIDHKALNAYMPMDVKEQVAKDRVSQMTKQVPIVSALYSATQLFSYFTGLGDFVNGRSVTGEQAFWAGVDVGLTVGTIIAGGVLNKLSAMGKINPKILDAALIDYLDDAAAAGSEATSLGRLGSLGRTPGKASATGRQVIEQMRAAGNIMEDADLGTLFKASNGQWYPLKLADMSHKVDAVTWWNQTGRAFGAKAPEVRQWMLDPQNYYLDLFSLNRSAGAKLGQTYLPPLK